MHLTKVVNDQNRKLHHLGAQGQHKQIALNSAGCRIEELQSTCANYETAIVTFNNQLVEEKQAHYRTDVLLSQEKDLFAKEAAHHTKTEARLEHQGQTLKRMSEFLSMIQITSTENKTLVLKTLDEKWDLGTLLLELEEKTKVIQELEKKLHGDRSNSDQDLIHELQDSSSMETDLKNLLPVKGKRQGRRPY